MAIEELLQRPTEARMWSVPLQISENCEKPDYLTFANSEEP